MTDQSEAPQPSSVHLHQRPNLEKIASVSPENWNTDPNIINKQSKLMMFGFWCDEMELKKTLKSCGKMDKLN